MSIMPTTMRMIPQRVRILVCMINEFLYLAFGQAPVWPGSKSKGVAGRVMGLK